MASLASLTELKLRLNRSDANDDTMLQAILDQATDYIHAQAGFLFLDSGPDTYTYDGSSTLYGRRCLLIPRGVQTLTLVETAPSTGASFATVTSTDYVLRPTAQERSPGWPATELWLTDTAALRQYPAGIANVRLTGTFGFAAVPDRVKEVCLNLAVRMYGSRQAGQADLIGSGGEGGSPMVSSYLSRRDKETLGQFRDQLVG